MKINKIQNIKSSIGILIKHPKGYLHKLNIPNKTKEEFKTLGFINSGQTLQHPTYKITSLAQKYYKETFGYLSYYKNYFLGAINKIKAAIT